MGPGEFGQVPKQAKPAPGTGGLHKLRPPQQRIPSKGNRKRKAHVQRIKKELGERANKPGVNFREAAAAVVYRTPVISRKLMPIEKKAQAFADRRPVREFSPLLKFGAEVGDLDRPEQQLNAVEAKLAREKKEREAAGPPNTKRKTEADLKADIRDPGRLLDDYLFLIIKKDRAEHAWQFPQGTGEDGEPLFETARREFQEECGKSIKVEFGRYLPMGHYIYEHPADRDGHTGTKLWFYRGIWLTGKPRLAKSENLVDYAWVSRKELKDYLSQEYYEYVEPILPRAMGPGDQRD
eukprot:TRINITY_DN1356_c0_g1_i4.p1 TRINITY_DN1356_c0_g1~~TRINITY_DN1356_c0_g1_i4.p1  ORF type:complete len:294 (+),score=46.04 TRINITY_DN1356_c0_g1_i4:324-1205(+)